MAPKPHHHAFLIDTVLHFPQMVPLRLKSHPEETRKAAAEVLPEIRQELAGAPRPSLSPRANSGSFRPCLRGLCPLTGTDWRLSPTLLSSARSRLLLLLRNAPQIDQRMAFLLRCSEPDLVVLVQAAPGRRTHLWVTGPLGLRNKIWQLWNSRWLLSFILAS